MAFTTNYAGSITDGVLIPAGEERHVTLYNVAAGIISTTSGEWLEVTSGSPTPTALQAHAGNITSSTTTAGSNPNTEDAVVIYQANDPNIGSEESRLIRLRISSVGSTSDWMSTDIMDTHTRNDLWSTNPNSSDGDFFNNIGNMSSTAQTGVLVNDHRLFTFYDSNYLFCALYDVVAGVTQGVMGFIYPNSVTGLDRDTLAHIWGIAAPPGASSTQNNGEIWCAAGSVTPGAAQVIYSHTGVNNSALPTNTTPAHAFARQQAAQITTNYADLGQIPRIRAVRADAVNNEFQEFTADTQTWLCLVKMDVLAWCIDLTS